MSNANYEKRSQTQTKLLVKKYILIEKSRCQTQPKLLVVATVWKERLYPYPGWTFCCHGIKIK